MKTDCLSFRSCNTNKYWGFKVLAKLAPFVLIFVLFAGCDKNDEPELGEEYGNYFSFNNTKYEIKASTIQIDYVINKFNELDSNYVFYFTDRDVSIVDLKDVYMGVKPDSKGLNIFYFVMQCGHHRNYNYKTTNTWIGLGPGTVAGFIGLDLDVTQHEYTIEERLKSGKYTISNVQHGNTITFVGETHNNNRVVLNYSGQLQEFKTVYNVNDGTITDL